MKTLPLPLIVPVSFFHSSSIKTIEELINYEWLKPNPAMPTQEIACTLVLQSVLIICHYTVAITMLLVIEYHSTHQKEKEKGKRKKENCWTWKIRSGIWLLAAKNNLSEISHSKCILSSVHGSFLERKMWLEKFWELVMNREISETSKRRKNNTEHQSIMKKFYVNSICLDPIHF